MRSSSQGIVVTAVLLAVVGAIPAAGRTGAAKKPKPIGKLVKILHDDVYVAGHFVTDERNLYAGGVVRTGARGRVRFQLDLKDTNCTLQTRTRIVVRPARAVALRVTSATGEVWCVTAMAGGTATFAGPTIDGQRTTIATKDPVFGLVVAKKKVVVKVGRGSVVVAGRSGRKRAVVVGRARQAVVPHGGDPQQPKPLALTLGQHVVAARLAAAVPAPQDTTRPVVRLLHVPGNPSDEVLGRFSFTAAGESRTDVTFACSLDGGGFYVCSSPLVRPFGTGTHTFAVRAVDTAGNVGTSISRTWKVAMPPAGWIVFESNRDGNYELYAMNADGGSEVRVTTDPSVEVDPAWSPKRDRLAFESDRVGRKASDIYVMNVDGRNLKRLTTEAANDRNPKWSRSGKRIAYETNRDGNYEIYVMNADGSHGTRLTVNTARDSEPAWSPDGTQIVFESERDGNPDLYVMSADGSNVKRLTNTTSAEFNPAWSPDGKRIAFDSDRNGSEDIYVMSADGGVATRLTTDPARDSDPAWSPDGSKIAFASNRNRTTEIYVMNADGGDQTQLTRSPGESLVPNW